jgi:hypothetical protein
MRYLITFFLKFKHNFPVKSLPLVKYRFLYGNLGLGLYGG